MNEAHLWWTAIKFSGSDLISAFALVVSIVALWVAWHFGRPQRQLAKVNLAKEAAEATKAKDGMILCRLTGSGPQNMRIVFGNAGKADARNITVDWGRNIDCERLFERAREDFPIDRVRPNGSITFPAAIYYEAPDRYRFNVSWDDDSGTRKTEAQNISIQG